MSDTDHQQEVPVPLPESQPLNQVVPSRIDAGVINAVNVANTQIIKEQHIHLSKDEQQTLAQGEDETRRRARNVERQELLIARLEYFVGRAKELSDLRAKIEKQQLNGGYVIVTGEAGQGKSSMIAKCIAEQGEEAGAFHFIRVNPGPDYQTNILRDLLEQLMLKYHLPAWYMSENYAVLRDSLRLALAEIAGQGKQEIITIDGLDLLETNANGVPDLSFLPDQPPAGIVFVVGTRASNRFHDHRE